MQRLKFGLIIFLALSPSVQAIAPPKKASCEFTLQNSSRSREAFKFFLQFLRHPGSIGSVFPSSQSLARAMVGASRIDEAPVVVELGVGTGPITRAILASKPPATTYLGLEPNTNFLPGLRRKFPDVEFLAASAEDLPKILADRGLTGGADVIFSELPWSIFDSDTQDRLLEACKNSLNLGGRMIAFNYAFALRTPGGQQFLRKLRQHFSQVRIGGLVFGNLPPARVLEIIK